MSIGTPPPGPDGFVNWRCYLDRLPMNDMVEIALYSDARLTAQAEFGPYQLINTIPTDPGEKCPMAAILRMQWHVPERDPLPNMEKSDQAAFHGGGLGDEIAALVSLALGARVQAGGVVRRFEPGGDPLGTPVQWSHVRPALPVARQCSIPGLTGGKNLSALPDPLARYPDVPPERAIEVLRAARSYQQGLWMADADPEYAWLKFVSALETAASCWWRGDNDAEDALRYTKPELADLLEAKGGRDLVRTVGEQLKDQMAATRKFLSFAAHYAPPPPPTRPLRAFQTDWTRLDSSMRLLYKCRSRSLHAGLPFPPPLLEAPREWGEGFGIAEKPGGLAAGVGRSVWLEKELPMFLHVFEYVTRATLLAWLCDPERGPTAVV